MRISNRIRSGSALAVISALALVAGTAQAIARSSFRRLPRSRTRSSPAKPGRRGTPAASASTARSSTRTPPRPSRSRGEIDAVNYYDSLNGSCPTDIGSNCSFNYGPNLDFDVAANFIGMTVTPTGGGFIDIVLDFQSTGGTDIIWTDPADGNSVMLTGQLGRGRLPQQPDAGPPGDRPRSATASAAAARRASRATRS